MLLPIGDAPNDHGTRPWANWALIAANVLAFGVARAVLGDAYGSWTQSWGFVPVAPRLETFFTSMFLHSDWVHLLGNVLFLWVFGDNVEGRLGHVGHLLAYAASGLAAILLFLAFEPAGTVPLVGASGAIFGVLGFYFVEFGRNRVKVVWWLFLVGVLWVPARWMLGVYFLLNLVYMLLVRGEEGGGGVAYAAHVGGFAVGLLLALALAALRRAPGAVTRP